jgi:threonine/homoserine/homoserine lactone efflux protein
MDFTFWKGVFIGVLIAFPSGPVGFLTLRRSYLFGLRSTMYSAVGAVMTDAFYGVVVGFGLKKIAKFLVMIAPYAEIVAGIALVIIGIRSFFHRLDIEHHEGENTPIQDIISTFLLNALNPTLIFSFTVLFTMIGMEKFVGNPREIITFLIGIACGTFLFWFAVSKAIKKLHERAQGHYIQQANKYTGIALGLIGAVLLVISIIHAVFR